jgi:hypothetical protein
MLLQFENVGENITKNVEKNVATFLKNDSTFLI